jgi:hypothetical protein
MNILQGEHVVTIVIFFSEISIHQYNMLVYIILPVVMGVFITGAVTCIIVYTMRKEKLGI